MTFQVLVRRAEVLVFLTRSTLPSWHTVIEHCTDYCVILHLTYLLYQIQTNSQIELNTGHDQNSPLSSNSSFRQICLTSCSHFHDFPGPRPDSRIFQAWENVTFEFQDFRGSEWTQHETKSNVLSTLPAEQIELKCLQWSTWLSPTYSHEVAGRFSVYPVHCKQPLNTVIKLLRA